jgi:serine/threonine-protein kinase
MQPNIASRDSLQAVNPLFFRLKQARFLRRVMLVLVTSFGLMALMAPEPASAEWLTHFQNWATGKCLDSNWNGDVYTLPCQRVNPYQTWEVRYFGQYGYLGARREIKDHATSRCLGSYGIGGAERTGECSNYGQIISAMKDVRGPNWGNVQFVAYDWNRRNTQNYPYCTDATGGFYAGDWNCNWGFYQTWRAW